VTVVDCVDGELIFESGSECDTVRLGSALAGVVCAGLTLSLNGQLGSGKTHFVRALATGLGVSESHVSSPTFVVLQQYVDGRIPLAHFDVYRLGDVDEFLGLGGAEYLDSGEWLCLVEWGERLGAVLPADHLVVEISHAGETSRLFRFRATGRLSAGVLGGLGQVLGAV